MLKNGLYMDQILKMEAKNWAINLKNWGYREKAENRKPWNLDQIFVAKSLEKMPFGENIGSYFF